MKQPPDALYNNKDMHGINLDQIILLQGAGMELI